MSIPLPLAVIIAVAAIAAMIFILVKLFSEKSGHPTAVDEIPQESVKAKPKDSSEFKLTLDEWLAIMLDTALHLNPKEAQNKFLDLVLNETPHADLKDEDKTKAYDAALKFVETGTSSVEKKTKKSSLYASLEGLGLSFQDVEGDGNCFFRAVSVQMGNREQEHLEYRNFSVEYMVQNLSQYTAFLTQQLEERKNQNPNTTITIDHVLQEYLEDRTWVHDIQVYAMFRVLNVNAVIIEPNGKTTLSVINTSSNAQTICLGYTGAHYVSVNMNNNPFLQRQVQEKIKEIKEKVNKGSNDYETTYRLTRDGIEPMRQVKAAAVSASS